MHDESTLGDTSIADEATTIFTITSGLLISSAIVLTIGISVYVHTLRFVIRSTSTIPRSKWTPQQAAASRLLFTSRGIQVIIVYQIILLLAVLWVGSTGGGIQLMFTTLQIIGIFLLPICIYVLVPAPPSISSISSTSSSSSIAVFQRASPALLS
jgi:fatty acid desaturase